jgi:hypothetical protein
MWWLLRRVCVGALLAQLVEQLKADAGFCAAMTTAAGPRLLVTECLPRPDVRGPDPLAVIHLTSADPVFAVGEHGKKPA